MSSNTKGSEQPQTISFIWKTVRPASSGLPPIKERVSLTPEMVGVRSHHWVIVSTEIKKSFKKGCMLLEVSCDCGFQKWLHQGSFTRGLSKSCQSCGAKRNHTERGHLLVGDKLTARLQKRANAMRQRCENPQDKGFKNYGARGIEFRFASIEECVTYMKGLPNCALNLSVDRIDNHGHYARGNLRFTTAKEQAANRRNTFYVLWKGQQVLASEWQENPYMQLSTVYKYVKKGMTGEEIIANAWESVAKKRKGWRELQRRLESMTC